VVTNGHVSRGNWPGDKGNTVEGAQSWAHQGYPSHCHALAEEISRIFGIDQVSYDTAKGEVCLSYDAANIDLDGIEEVVRKHCEAHLWQPMTIFKDIKYERFRA